MRRVFWWKHARLPLCAFALLATVLSFSWTDVTIARTLFFDPSAGQWIGSGNWWVNAFLHTGGRWAVRLLVLTSACFWIAGSTDVSLRAVRRPAAYFILSVVLSVGIVGLLKTVTNVDCPWDLGLFGGQYPLVHLFADRPDALRQGHCFPAAHASSGYALMALYFVLRERSSVLAKWGLFLGASTGVVFGFAQQSRGAHFISHDIWSAMIAWLVALTAYTFVFGARLWDGSAAGCAVSELLSKKTRIVPALPNRIVCVISAGLSSSPSSTIRERQSGKDNQGKTIRERQSLGRGEALCMPAQGVLLNLHGITLL